MLSKAALSSLGTYEEIKKYYIVREAVGIYDNNHYSLVGNRKLFFEKPILVYFSGSEKTLAADNEQPYTEIRSHAYFCNKISDALSYMNLLADRGSSQFLFGEDKHYLVEELHTITNSLKFTS